MKFYPLLLVAVLLPTWAPAQQLDQLMVPERPKSTASQKVLRFALDEMRPVPVPTNPLVTTTIVFPSAIGGVDAIGFTDSVQLQNQNGAEFYMAFKEGNSYLSIAPLKSNSARNINIFYKGKVYAFEPYPVNVDAAITTLIMIEGPGSGSGGSMGSMGTMRGLGDNMSSMHTNMGSLDSGNDSIIKQNTMPPKVLKTASSESILGVIDALKTLSIFNQDQLQDALTSMPDMALSIRDGKGPDVTDNGDYSVAILKVLRQNKLDVLAFEVAIENKTSKPLLLDPESFTIRRGDKVYYSVTSDFDGDIPANQHKIAYFALIGTTEGAPNWLSPSNTFAISLDTLNDRVQKKQPFSFPDNTHELENPSVSDLPYPPTGSAPSEPAPMDRHSSSESMISPDLHAPGTASLEPPPDEAPPIAVAPTGISK